MGLEVGLLKAADLLEMLQLLPKGLASAGCL
jgi:hypothetical protein